MKLRRNRDGKQATRGVPRDQEDGIQDRERSEALHREGSGSRERPHRSYPPAPLMRSRSVIGPNPPLKIETARLRLAPASGGGAEVSVEESQPVKPARPRATASRRKGLSVTSRIRRGLEGWMSR